MSNAIMIVRTGPTSPDREAEFNAWLTGTHIPDVLRIEGFGSARRFRASDVLLTPDVEPPSPGYMHVYELDTEGADADIEQLRDALLEAIESGAAALSDDLDLSVTTTYFYVPVGERIEGAG